jgi:polysaccharide biosynthesis protein PslJ
MLRVLAGGGERGPVISAAVVVTCIAILSLTVAANLPTVEVSIVVLAVVVASVAYRHLLTWSTLLSAMILVILFVPIKRYTLPGNMPFDLEAYRLLVVVVLWLWITSLLIDSRVTLRRSGFEGPLAAVVLVAFASVLANIDSIVATGIDADVIKELMFLASFVLVFYLLVSVTRTRDRLESILKVLVGGGAVVAAGALVEYRTGTNIFDEVASRVPLLTSSDAGEIISRGGSERVVASGQGPISLGALLVMLAPLATYVAVRSRSYRWWGAAGLLVVASFATVSRTTIVMLLVVGLVFVLLKPREALRFWPALIPAVLVIQFAVPGTLGSLRASFFPEGGLIAEQSMNPGWSGSGRIADLGPAMEEFEERPVLGQGYGTRRPTGPNATQILDDQWLKTLLETGLMGVFAWAWLFVRFVRRLGRRARRADGELSWLSAALAASVASFAVGMFVYDAFSFIQATFVLFVLLALGAVTTALPDEEQARVRRAVVPRVGAVAESPSG